MLCYWSSKNIPMEDLLPLTLYVIKGDLVGPGGMVRYISPLPVPRPPPQGVANLPDPKSAVPDSGWELGIQSFAHIPGASGLICM